MTDKPLVSFLLFAYNQEFLIQKAVSSVLAQDYPKLEIIISDDCSQDGTFEAIKRVVRNYKGLHRVILNRNQTNLGVTVHFNRVVSMAKGEFIVVAAGDDLSFPQRVSKLEKEWRERGVSAVFSNAMVIDNSGNNRGVLFSTPPAFLKNIEAFKEGGKSWATGATLAFEKDIFTKYGEINNFQEDGVIAFRALLEKGLGYVNQPLVGYRTGGVSGGLSVKDRLKFQLNEYSLYKDYLKDALLARPDDEKLLKILRQSVRKAYVKKLIFSIPFVGLCYNFVLIKLKGWIRR